jgi:hypothetical protein
VKKMLQKKKKVMTQDYRKKTKPRDMISRSKAAESFTRLIMSVFNVLAQLAKIEDYIITDGKLLAV